MTDAQKRYGGMIAGALAVIGAVLPWAKLDTVFGSISRNGVDDGGDGIFTLILGAVAVFAFWQGGRWVYAALAGGIVISAIAIYDIFDVREVADKVNDDAAGLAKASVGFGLYLTLLAGIGIVVVAGIRWSEARTGAPESVRGDTVRGGPPMPPTTGEGGNDLPPPPAPT